MASKDKFTNYDNGQLNVRCGFNYQDYVSLITIFLKINDDNLVGIEFISDLFFLENSIIHFYEIKNCEISKKHINELKNKLCDIKYANKKIFISPFNKIFDNFRNNDIEIISYDTSKIINILIEKIQVLFKTKITKNIDIMESFIVLIKTKVFDNNLPKWKLNKISKEKLELIDLSNYWSLKNSCYSDRFFSKDDFKKIILNTSRKIVNKISYYFFKREVLEW